MMLLSHVNLNTNHFAFLIYQTYERCDLTSLLAQELKVANFLWGPIFAFQDN